MISSNSSLRILQCISESSSLPGTKAITPPCDLVAFSNESSLSFDFWFFASGPWHLKHLSDKIGRICWLKSICAMSGAWQSNKMQTAWRRVILESAI